MGGDALVDLVCGPVSPLPETYQRYRLVARLGAGGQADVYRGVRLCGGVTSAPVSVKVFRLDPNRPLVDELRSWDKGDAALMDLNNRGVPGICRRVDGFYGPVPHVSGVAPTNDAVPYQVYDYLHGVNLREYVRARASANSGPRMSATALLAALADTIKAMHHPQVPGACPVLHMDVKPSNIMVLATGETRLIDFTGARYWRSEEITRIAYTPESGGPEALRGEVSPSYDVHGFGSVAFYLLTGTPPRGSSAPALHRNPVFDGRPALREHMLAVLADDPSQRPSTMELSGWANRLGSIARASHLPDLGLDWREHNADARGAGSEERRAVGRARPVIAGTETDAYQRIQVLERELVALRARVGRPVEQAARVALPPVSVSPAPVSTRPVSLATPVPTRPLSPAASAGWGGTALETARVGNGRDANGDGISMRPGRAVVVPRLGPAPVPGPAGGYPSDGPVVAPPARVAVPVGDRMRRLKRGGSWSVVGACFALLCWIIWAAANRSRGVYVAPMIFVGTLAVALGLFVVLRLLGRLVLEQWMHRTRAGARGAHIVTGLFLMAVGVTYLQQTSWIVTAYHWLKGLK